MMHMSSCRNVSVIERTASSVLSLFGKFCLHEKGFLYGLVEAYNCIALTNFEHTKFNYFQNLSPETRS